MKKRVCLIVFIIIFAGGWTGQATSSDLTIPNRQAVTTAIASKEALYGPLTRSEGEVVSVDGDRLQLATGSDLVKTFTIPPSCPIYVNGRQGSLSALRPVAPGSYFAARIHLDPAQIPRLVEGWYVGGLATIMAVDSRLRKLCVQTIESNKVYCLVVPPMLEEEVSRLTPGKICFLLLGWEAQVRKIYVDQ